MTKLRDELNDDPGAWATARARSPIHRLLALLILGAALPAQAAQWLPVTPQELHMTEEPQAPKAPAIVLYRQVDRDDSGFVEHNYVRLKILTEEGRQYANVELLYDSRESIHSIEARTVRPDGSSSNFEGTIYDKRVAEGGGASLRAKAFALPEVPVGSIIEYRYTLELAQGIVFNSQWILSQNLFTKEAKFSLQPNRRFSLRFSWPLGLPDGTNPPTKVHDVIRLESHNVPAFVKEAFMPPENQFKYRVEFIYVPDGNDETDPVRFWRKFGLARFRTVEDFVNERRVMAQAVSQIVMPEDTPEVKLRKIYARAQQVRNLSAEPKRSEQEKEREQQREPKDAADVWQHGYGTGHQINWLFLALVRAAGMTADPVLLSNRETVFFNPQLMNPGQLSTNAVLVLDHGKEIFLDPGAALAPFGMLPWGKTGVRGLLLDKEGGRWVDTPLPTPSESRVEHKADFRLSASGALTGRVVMTITGREARARRLHERNEDAAHRVEFLENLLKVDIPGHSDAMVVHEPDWDNAESSFIAEYDVTIPDWATLTGQRALMGMSVFSGRWKHAFEHAVRVHPIYFPFPFEYSDEVRIELPVAWHVVSLPPARGTDSNVLSYHCSAAMSGGALELERSWTSKVVLLDTKYHDGVRDFFQSLRSADAEQLVLAAGVPSARMPSARMPSAGL